MKILFEDSKARVGKLKTGHGVVNTPFFMPIATKGTVKQVSSSELVEDTIIRGEGVLSSTGALAIDTGEFKVALQKTNLSFKMS